MAIEVIQAFTTLPVTLTDIRPNDVIAVVAPASGGPSFPIEVYLDAVACNEVGEIHGSLYAYGTGGLLCAWMVDTFDAGEHELTIGPGYFNDAVVYGVVLRGVVGSDGGTAIGWVYEDNEPSGGDIYYCEDGVVSYDLNPIHIPLDVASQHSGYVILGYRAINDHPSGAFDSTVAGVLAFDNDGTDVYRRVYDIGLIEEALDVTVHYTGITDPAPDSGYSAESYMNFIVLYEDPTHAGSTVENPGPIVPGNNNNNNNHSEGPGEIPRITVPVVVKDNAAKLIVVLVSGIAGAGSSVQSIIVNDMYLTKAGSELDDDGVTFVEAWYTATAPVYGEYIATVTFVDTVKAATVGSLVFYGMDTGTPVYGWMSNDGVGAAHKLEYDLTDYRLIVDVLAVQGTDSVNVNPTITTEIPYYVQPAGIGPLMYGAASYKNNSKSGAMYWLSAEGALPRRYAHGLLVLNRNLYTDVPPDVIIRDDPADPEIPYEPPPDGSDDPPNPETEPANAQSCTVTGNTFLACTGMGVQLYTINQIHISNNTFNTMHQCPIYAEYITNFHITDNLMQGNQDAGIYVSGGRDGYISNNTLQDCALNPEHGYGSRPMIFMGCDSISVLGNRIFSYDIIHNYAIYFNVYCKNMVVMGNDLTHSFLLEKFEDHGLDSYKENNAPEQLLSERVQDIIGSMTSDSYTIEPLYDDDNNSITYVVIPGTVDADMVDGVHAAGFAPLAHDHALADLTDVSDTAPADNQVLTWNESWQTWEPSTAIVTGITPAVFAITNGNGVDTAYNIGHLLGTTDVLVQVFEIGGDHYQMYPAVRIIDEDSVQIEFTNAPALNSFRVVITSASAAVFDGTIDWSGIENVPSTFPPSTHTHIMVLDDLTDVAVGSPGDGQALVWIAGSSEWQPFTVLKSDQIIASDTIQPHWDNVAKKLHFDMVKFIPSMLNHLDDLDAPNPADGQALVWDDAAGYWVPKTITGGGGGTSVQLEPLTNGSWDNPELIFFMGDVVMAYGG